MKIATSVFFFVTLLSLVIALPPTSIVSLQGETIVVTNPADSGPGTLRQALLDVKSGDTITFDPTIFSPAAPVTVFLTSELPHLYQGNLTIDASKAGVILDGSSVPGEWSACLQIVNSDANTIRGLQISNFSGAGIAISGDAQYNLIGGDRGVGSGPFGQGNLFSNNDAGVVLSSVGTSLNTVTGNLIGTDATGTDQLGNQQQGIWITGSANRNIIGPDNVIAHNGKAGIEVYERETVQNTITRNSIHDNGWQGIDMWGGNDLQGLPLSAGNNFLIAPSIFDFDLQAGSVKGTACYNCTVEIFSDDSDEGACFEGQITADRMGIFILDKGASLNGPHLTATATDKNGNTSEFSLPTTGAEGSLTLQQSNDFPAYHLQIRNSSELLDNRIGRAFTGLANPGTYDVPTFYDMGAKRALVAINHQEPEYVFWDRSEFDISPEWDNVVTRMAENGLIVKYKLTFWDKITWPDGVGAPCARFKTEGEIERYLEFVEFIVHNFKDRIQYYEMWNEPDIANYCPKWIEVEDYINLVKRTAPVIRAEYPNAKIAVGAVSSPMEPDAREYLFTLLESDIMPLVDVVSWHPMYGTSPEYEFHRDYYYNYPAFVQEIKDLARAHGFDGEYQVDELTWWTTRPPGDFHEGSYSPTKAAKYASRAIVMHLGMDVATGIHEGAGNTFPNLCTTLAGALPTDLPVQIQSTVTNTLSYTFSLPNSDHLIALWNNGIAADYDPGITSIVTIPGFQDYTVTGIDILHGFEQPMITSEEDGNLVIRNLLLKDYPILLRLNSTKNLFLPILLNAHLR
jgi:hypothetical protein